MPIVSKICAKCRKLLSVTNFYRNNHYRDGLYATCKSCHANHHRKKVNGHQYRLWFSSLNNARRKGVKHTIKPSDIKCPKVCKYLGINLEYRRSSETGILRAWNAPSIDRIDPSRGYEPDNIQVISDLANKMKQNATVDQLIAFAQGVFRVHGSE